MTLIPLLARSILAWLPPPRPVRARPTQFSRGVEKPAQGIVDEVAFPPRDTSLASVAFRAVKCVWENGYNHSEIKDQTAGAKSKSATSTRPPRRETTILRESR